jgi:hypothetical protein
MTSPASTCLFSVIKIESMMPFTGERTSLRSVSGLITPVVRTLISTRMMNINNIPNTKVPKSSRYNTGVLGLYSANCFSTENCTISGGNILMSSGMGCKRKGITYAIPFPKILCHWHMINLRSLIGCLYRAHRRGCCFLFHHPHQYGCCSG